MLKEEQIETVLISTSAEATGQERIVVAFRQEDDLYIPLDSDRPANQDLLDVGQLYIRRVDDQDEYAIYDVQGHRVISTSDRQRLEAFAHTPISVTTEVLHVTGTHASVGRLHSEKPGFVAIIDGSHRALRALGPAAELARWLSKPLRVYAVTKDHDDTTTRQSVERQLLEANIADDHVTYITKADLEARLFEVMRQGHIAVASAFGVWDIDGRLHGTLNGVVRHNAPAIIGIGPNMPLDWKPAADHPVVVCVDATDHAHDLVDKIDPFISRPGTPVTVAHVTTEKPVDMQIATDVAGEIRERTGIAVKAADLKGTAAAPAIAGFAAAAKAQLVIMSSWHRRHTGEPLVSSTSVNAVATMPCPVVILSGA